MEETGLLVDGRDYYRAFYQAAQQARRYILIAGWQFDSAVPLLRGRDRRGVRLRVRLLPFLKTLCEANPTRSCLRFRPTTPCGRRKASTEAR